jgi:hypothetical protein
MGNGHGDGHGEAQVTAPGTNGDDRTQDPAVEGGDHKELSRG